MAESKKARIFLRRGLDADRLQTPLCEGELGYSTDSKRVFVGDGSTDGGYSLGTTLFIKDSASFNLGTLNDGSSSGEGKGEVGDLLLKPAADFNITDINSNVTTSSNISPDSGFSTVHALTSYAGNTLSWVAINSGIPFSHIDMGNDYINGDYIHGGDISGDVVFSGTVSASTLTATNVSATNVRVTSLAGSGNRAVVVDSDGDLVVTSSGSGMVQGAVTFDQSGSTGYSYSITSVNLITLATFNSELSTPAAVGSLGSNSGSPNVDQYAVLSNATDATYGHYTNSGATGIYKIVFNKSFTTASTLVEAQAFLWRPPAISTNKNMINYNPIVDYYWSGTITSNTLYVVFSVADISNVNHNAKGWLENLYPSSGIVDTRTTFAVKVY